MRLTPISPRLRWIAAWVVATALLIVCARSIDWTRAAAVVATVDARWIIPAIICNAGILPFWTLFWSALVPRDEPPVPYKRMFGIVATTATLVNTMPFGAGHAVGVTLLNKRGGLSMNGSLAVLALEQLGEGLSKVTIFLLVVLLVPLPGWMRAGVTAACIGVSVWLLTLVVASRWRRELQLLHRPMHALRAFTCVAAIKLIELLAIVAVQHAFGLEFPWSSRLLVLASVILGTILPLAPGNLGTYETSVFLAYRYLGVSGEQALSLAIAQHVAFMIPAVGIGYLFVSAQTVARTAIASR